MYTCVELSPGLLKARSFRYDDAISLTYIQATIYVHKFRSAIVKSKQHSCLFLWYSIQ